MWEKLQSFTKHLIKKITQRKTISHPTSTKLLSKLKEGKVIFTIALCALLIILFGFSFFKKQPPLIINQEKNNPITIGSDGNDMKHWIVKNEATIDTLKTTVQDQDKHNAEYANQINELKDLLSKQNQQIGELKDWFIKQQTEVSANINDFRDQVASELQQQSSIPKTDEDDESEDDNNQLENKGQANDLVVYAPPESKDDESAKPKTIVNPYKGYLPVGAFFKATLLTGITAPTGAIGESNPVPVLMKVMTNATLPNDKHHYQLKGCFIMGVAFGSVSSERVKIKLAKISCINPDGTSAVASELRGFVVDSDGIADLRGKFENRQGGKIAMATLAGFAQGIGQMFGNAQGTSVLTPGVSGIELNTDQKLKAAGFNGVGQAANTVAQFYVKQAEEIFPVIIVTTGRNITINITEGVTLNWVNIQDDGLSIKPNDNIPEAPQKLSSLSYSD